MEARTVFSMAIAGIFALFSVSASAAPTKAELEEALKVIQSASSAESSAMVERYSAQEVKAILAEEGYGSIRVDGESKVVFKSGGHTIVMAIYGDGDLQLYFGATGIKVTTDDINQWNREKRLSRSYLDNDGDVALEADLFANAGLNKKMVQEFTKIFCNISLPAYIKFVREKDSS